MWTVVVRVVPISIYDAALPKKPDTGLVPPFLPSLRLRCHTMHLSRGFFESMATMNNESYADNGGAETIAGLSIEASTSTRRPDGTGVPIITHVEPDSPAGRAGLRVGHVIVSIGDTLVLNYCRQDEDTGGRLKIFGVLERLAKAVLENKDDASLPRPETNTRVAEEYRHRDSAAPFTLTVLRGGCSFDTWTTSLPDTVEKCTQHLKTASLDAIAGSTGKEIVTCEVHPRGDGRAIGARFRQVWQANMTSPSPDTRTARTREIPANSKANRTAGGMWVADVVDGSPANAAGLKADDMVVKIGAERVLHLSMEGFVGALIEEVSSCYEEVDFEAPVSQGGVVGVVLRLRFYWLLRAR